MSVLITVEDKIKTFAKYVYEKELKHSNAQIERAEIKNNEILGNRQKEVEEKSGRMAEKYDKKIQVDTQHIISSAKRTANERVMGLKKHLLEDLIQEIRRALIHYTQQKAYRAYMENIINTNSDYIQKKARVIYLTKKDMTLFSKTLLNLSPRIKILEMKDENIGGMIILSETGKESIDLSFKRKIQHWHNEIGLRLYEALDKVGESFE